MRQWLAALCLAVIASPAGAEFLDTPPLRGSDFIPDAPRYVRWEGIYFGAHAGYASGTANFSGGVADMVANILRNTTVQNEFQPSNWVNLPAQATTQPSYGAFVGYNFQFDNAVVGFEANYNRTNMTMTSGDTVARVVNTSDGYANDVTVSGTARVNITDYGTLRLRGGWATDAGFMPYAFVGAALARASLTRSASVFIIGTDADPSCVGPPNTCLPPYVFSQSQTDTKNNQFAYGWSVGGGIDWALTPNIFLRGEAEYISFPYFFGTSMSIATARAGGGVKF